MQTKPEIQELITKKEAELQHLKEMKILLDSLSENDYKLYTSFTVHSLIRVTLRALGLPSIKIEPTPEYIELLRTANELGNILSDAYEAKKSNVVEDESSRIAFKDVDNRFKEIAESIISKQK